MIYFVLGFFLGFFGMMILREIDIDFRPSPSEEIMSKNIAPPYWADKGHWEKIVICNECDVKIANVDWSIFQPCPKCGSESGRSRATARWDGEQWEVKK